MPVALPSGVRRAFIICRIKIIYLLTLCRIPNVLSDRYFYSLSTESHTVPIYGINAL